MHPLGIVLSTATSAPPKEFVELGQIAEDKGFAAVLVNEGRGDALACAEAIALGTSHIKVGTNIANIYFRHPFLAGMTANRSSFTGLTARTGMAAPASWNAASCSLH